MLGTDPALLSAMTAWGVFRTYSSYVGLERQATLFEAEKDGHTIRCEFWTHPFGWEVRLLIGDELIRSQVAKSEPTVLDICAEWRAETESKGWVT